MAEITSTTILNWLTEQVESKKPIAPQTWLDACQKLLMLVGEDQVKLYGLQQKIAQKKVEAMEQGDTAAKAKMKAEASDEYLEAQVLKSMIERVYEMIRVSKLQARLNFDEYRSQ